MKKTHLLVNSILIFLLSIAFVPPRASAQSSLNLSIDQINSAAFPQVDLEVSVLDNYAYPVDKLSAENFSISEDGLLVDDLTCTELAEYPLAITLVIDTSNSMGFGELPTPMQNTISSAMDFIQTLGTHDRVSIIRFSNDVEILQELTDDKELASNKLSQMEPVENTALNDALIVGTRTLRDSAERRVLLLITDGVDSGISQASFEEAVTEIAKHNIVLHTIGWLGVNGTALQDLADLTHGSFQSISNSYPDLLALQSAFQNVSRDLVNQRQLYHLSYTSNLKADAGEHEMNVSVDHLGMHAENSRHFVATPNQVSVEMTDLAPEQSIWGSVVFEPTVVAPAPIAKFDVLIDGNSIGSVIKEPFQLDWDSRQTPGRHEFTFIATDSAGNSGQISIPLNVELPLIAQIESPSDGAQIKDATDVVIGVSGPSELHQLEVFVDSNSIGKIEDPSRQDLYKIPWDLSGATEGAHTISIVAEDLDGFQSQDSIKVNLVLGGTGPLAIVIAVVVVAALIIPLGLRSRKRRTKTAISGESSEGSEHAPSGSMVLLELSGLNPNHVWSFESSEIRLGRKRDANDIPLQGTRASRRHAVIQFQQGECIVTSLNPENPILVNNVPVTNKALSPGDILKAGDTVLRFEGKGS